jgi:hypothetical protein
MLVTGSEINCLAVQPMLLDGSITPSQKGQCTSDMREIVKERFPLTIATNRGNAEEIRECTSIVNDDLPGDISSWQS